MSQFESNGVDYDEAYDLGEDFDDEAYDLGEASLLSRARQIPRLAMGLMGRIPTTPYRGSATIDTPAGRANVAMPSDLVSKKEFQALEARVLANNRAILGTGKVVSGLSVSTKKLEINAARTRKKFQGLQQGQLFSALLPPKLTSLTISEEKDKNGNPIVARSAAVSKDNPETLTVQSAKFDLMTTLLPMIASGAIGGSTDGGGSSSMSMMLPLILIMNDKDKGSNDKDDNSTLLLVMMMMMMGK